MLNSLCNSLPWVLTKANSGACLAVGLLAKNQMVYSKKEQWAIFCKHSVYAFIAKTESFMDLNYNVVFHKIICVRE